MVRGFCPRGFCPEGAYVLMELCMEGVLSEGVLFCPRGFCPEGVLSYIRWCYILPNNASFCILIINFVTLYV